MKPGETKVEKYRRDYASVFHCYMTNYNQCNGLKQHPFIISVLWVRNLGGLAQGLCSASHGLRDQDAGWSGLLSGGSGKNLLQVLSGS